LLAEFHSNLPPIAVFKSQRLSHEFVQVFEKYALSDKVLLNHRLRTYFLIVFAFIGELSDKIEPGIFPLFLPSFGMMPKSR